MTSRIPQLPTVLVYSKAGLVALAAGSYELRVFFILHSARGEMLVIVSYSTEHAAADELEIQITVLTYWRRGEGGHGSRPWFLCYNLLQWREGADILNFHYSPPLISSCRSTDKPNWYFRSFFYYVSELLLSTLEIKKRLLLECENFQCGFGISPSSYDSSYSGNQCQRPVQNVYEVPARCKHHHTSASGPILFRNSQSAS